MAAIMEQVRLEEEQQAEAARIEPATIALREPESAELLRHTHRLIALLLACGSRTQDIATELGLTAEQVYVFESNLLIQNQAKAYKERFWGSGSQDHLKSMMPTAVRFIEDVLNAEGNEIDASKRLETARWLIEKITGKAAQQIDVSAAVNFSHILAEMKRMSDARTAIQGGAPHSPANSHTLIDVTPAKPKQDQFGSWITDWQKRQGNE